MTDVQEAFSRVLDRIVQQTETLNPGVDDSQPSYVTRPNGVKTIADELRELHAQFAESNYDEETRSRMVYFLFENTERILFAMTIKDQTLTEIATRPVAIVTPCPKCGQIHVDEGEWRTRRHRTHSCVPGPHGPGCGFKWRPSNHPTVGVDWRAINEVANGMDE